MEEAPHRISRRNNVETHCKIDAVYEENRRQRHYNHHTHGDEEKCSGKRCRSWAAVAIADCVALFCCPCAIINFLTLTFIKVPWMIGRRRLGDSWKKKNKRRLHKRQRRKKINIEDGFHHQNNQHRQLETAVENEKCSGGGDDDGHRFVVKRDGSLTKEEEEKTTSSRGDEERVWLELYQIGQLGFGSAPFTGIQ